MDFTAEKSINLQRIIAELNLFKEEIRDDIRWLLEHYKDENIFNKGEIEQFRLILKSYQLIDKYDKLTKFGKDVLNQKQGIMIPEYGIYEIILYSDITTGELEIIAYDHKQKKDIEGNTDFKEYRDIEDIIFVSWHDNTRFKVFFIKSSEKDYPKISKVQDVIGKLRIIINRKKNEESQSLVIQASTGQQSLKHEDLSFNSVDLQATLTSLEYKWDPAIFAIRETFENVAHTPIIQTFTTTLTYQDQELIFKGPILPEHKTNYTVTIQDVPVIPADGNEALQWAWYLIEQYLRDFDEYCTINHALSLAWETKIKGTPIDTLYYNVKTKFDTIEVLARLKNLNNPLFHKIQTFKDLSLK